MAKKGYKLYDENLVKNIIITTTVSVYEYIKEKPDVDIRELCDHFGDSSKEIIVETINNMQNIEKESFDNSEHDDWE
jgi:hypothetical protein